MTLSISVSQLLVFRKRSIALSDARKHLPYKIHGFWNGTAPSRILAHYHYIPMGEPAPFGLGATAFNGQVLFLSLLSVSVDVHIFDGTLALPLDSNVV